MQSNLLTENSGNSSNSLENLNKNISQITIEESTNHSFQCLICLESNVSCYVIPICNHTVLCGFCYILNKLKFDRNACPVCMESLDYPIISSSKHPAMEYNSYDSKHLVFSNSIGAKFADVSSKKMLERKLQILCPICKVNFPIISKLKDHVKELHHGKEFCNICLKKRKVFIVDQKLYDPKDLTMHRNEGDKPTQTEIKTYPHIRCNLCKEWTYDKDDFKSHMLLSHCCCQLCKRRNTEVWLADENSLTNHYRSHHITCDFEECLSRPIENVFFDEIELQSHILQVHSKNQSKQERKAAARLNLDFTYANSGSQMVSSMHSNNSSTSASSSSSSNTIDEKSYPKLGNTSNSKPSHIDLNSEMIAILGNMKYQHFRLKSIEFFESKISPQEYYDLFCSFFRNHSSLAIIWMKLVNSLPNYQLREQLHQVHFEAVKKGNGLNTMNTNSVSDNSNNGIRGNNTITSSHSKDNQSIWSNQTVPSQVSSNASLSNRKDEIKKPLTAATSWAAPRSNEEESTSEKESHNNTNTNTNKKKRKGKKIVLLQTGMRQAT